MSAGQDASHSRWQIFRSRSSQRETLEGPEEVGASLCLCCYTPSFPKMHSTVQCNQRVAATWDGARWSPWLAGSDIIEGSNYSEWDRQWVGVMGWLFMCVWPWNEDHSQYTYIDAEHLGVTKVGGKIPDNYAEENLNEEIQCCNVVGIVLPSSTAQ